MIFEIGYILLFFAFVAIVVGFFIGAFYFLITETERLPHLFFYTVTFTMGTGLALMLVGWLLKGL